MKIAALIQRTIRQILMIFICPFLRVATKVQDIYPKFPVEKTIFHHLKNIVYFEFLLNSDSLLAFEELNHLHFIKKVTIFLLKQDVDQHFL